MGDEAPEVGKGLFGYRRTEVQRLISEREILLRQAEGRVRAAEGRVAELEEEMGALRAHSRQIEQQLERVTVMLEAWEARGPGTGGPPIDMEGSRGTPARPRTKEEGAVSDMQTGQPGAGSASPAGSPAGHVPASEITARFLTEELAGILTAAEQSAARIVERAQVSTDQQLAEANRLWREVQGELARFAEWREQVEPIIDQVRTKVDEVRAQIGNVPERIREALAPMADSISVVDAHLADLSASSPPPTLIPPAGLDVNGSTATEASATAEGASTEASAEDEAEPADEDATQ